MAVPPRSLDQWFTIDGTRTTYAEPLVVTAHAMPWDSSMVDVVITYPTTPIESGAGDYLATAVRIDLHRVYFQSFTSEMSNFLEFRADSARAMRDAGNDLRS